MGGGEGMIGVMVRVGLRVKTEARARVGTRIRVS